MTKEQEMVDAHKNGQAAYHLGNAGASMARTLAHKLYRTEHEREAYIAGYLGEMRRAVRAEWTAEDTAHSAAAAYEANKGDTK